MEAHPFCLPEHHLLLTLKQPQILGREALFGPLALMSILSSAIVQKFHSAFLKKREVAFISVEPMTTQ